LITWKVLAEGLQHPTLTLYGQFELDISAVLIKKAVSESSRFAIHDKIHFPVPLL
jgi:hypothetical protein